MAGRIPQSFIDDLLARADIVEVIDARVPLKKAGREYMACCPFHNEKTPSFTVSPAKQFYHCFGCGAHGTALGFLMEYERLSFPEAVEALARDLGLEVPREEGGPGPRRDRGREDLYDLLGRAGAWYRDQLRHHPQARRAVDYLKARGLSGEVAARFGLGFAPPGWDNLARALGSEVAVREKLVAAGMLVRKEGGGVYDRFRDRIMFPIRDRRGRTIAFGGRILPDTREGGERAPAKYLNSPETPVFHKGRELYGLWEVLQARRRPQRLLVVEGYMDVVALAQHGIDCAVATLGTATTREHLQQLFKLVPEVVFCFDGDAAGRRAAWRALETALPVLRDGLVLRFMFLPEGEDPDSRVRAVGREGFEADLAAARPLSDFFFEHLAAELDLSTAEGRARLVDQARPLLGRLRPGVFRDMMRQRLAELARLDPSRLDGGDARAPGLAPAAGPRRPAPGQSTPVRRAVAALLHEPALAAAAPAGALEGVDLPGADLLRALLETLREHPHLTFDALLQRFSERGQWSAWLVKLAAQPPLVAGEALETEFLASLRRLEEQWLEQRREHLPEAAVKGLPPEQRRLLHRPWRDLSEDDKTLLKQIVMEHPPGDAPAGGAGSG